MYYMYYEVIHTVIIHSAVWCMTKSSSTWNSSSILDIFFWKWQIYVITFQMVIIVYPNQMNSYTVDAFNIFCSIAKIVKTLVAFCYPGHEHVPEIW